MHKPGWKQDDLHLPDRSKPAPGSAWRRWMPRGPGMLVAAAFVGPGTVTTCALAGARFGTTLLWALPLSLAAGMVLQEMSARLGVMGRIDLAAALRARPRGVAGRTAVAVLVVLAVGVGAAAYQVGNLLGAGLGMAAVAGGDPRLWSLACAAVAGWLLWSGGFRRAARVLSALVAVMGVCFVATAIAAAPPWRDILRGLVVPTLGPESITLVLALVGTTVVPYNLFLHAAAARDRWPGIAGMGEPRRDLVVSFAAGGLVSAAILITAAGLPAATDPAGGFDFVRQLDPVLGPAGRMMFGFGLFAAGLSSAMTAPMAAAAALTSLFGRTADPARPAFRAVWITVMVIGAGFALAGRRPLTAILLAQAANGLLLPVAALFLLVVMNDRARLGRHRNGPRANAAGALVVLLVAILGGMGIARAIGWM